MIRFLLIFFIYLSSLYADECNKDISLYFPDKSLKELGILIPDGRNFVIPRFGKPLETLGKLYEIKIDSLRPLHPIPNPLREYSESHLSELLDSIKVFGYNRKFSIQVGVMKDGQLWILGGHHRVKAMGLLKEEFIPSELIIWENLDKNLRERYFNEIIKPLQEVFPENFQDIKIEEYFNS